MALNERITELALNIAHSRINAADKLSADLYQDRLTNELGVLLYTILSEKQEKYFYRAIEDLEDIQEAEDGCGVAGEAISILDEIAEALCCSDVYREFRSDYTTEFFLLPFIATLKPDSTLESTYAEGSDSNAFMRIGDSLHTHSLVHPASIINIAYGFLDHDSIPDSLQGQIHVADSVMGIGIRAENEIDINAGDPQYTDSEEMAYTLRYLCFSVATPKKNQKQYKLALLNNMDANTKEGEADIQ